MAINGLPARTRDDHFFSRLGAAIERECLRAAAAFHNLAVERPGPDTPDRWRQALAVAEEQGIGLYAIDGVAIAMGRGPRLRAYRTDGVQCECPRAVSGDPVCPHRALFRAKNGGIR
jgi:hypothetical protein